MVNEEDKKKDEEEKEEDKKGEDVKEEEEKEDKNNINKDIEESAEISDENKKHNKQLKKIFFVIGILVLFFLGVFLSINSMNHFTYKNIDFEVVKEGQLILYRTSLPVKMTNQVTGQVVTNDYNFYFRKDPRKLEDVVFDGKINLKHKVVMNFTENFNCDGDGIIGVANLLNLFSLLQFQVEKNESLGCNKNSKYTFIRLQSGNETFVEQFHTNCYDLNINNCEALEATERYMLEVFVKLNEA